VLAADPGDAVRSAFMTQAGERAVKRLRDLGEHAVAGDEHQRVVERRLGIDELFGLLRAVHARELACEDLEVAVSGAGGREPAGLDLDRAHRLDRLSHQAAVCVAPAEHELQDHGIQQIPALVREDLLSLCRAHADEAPLLEPPDRLADHLAAASEPRFELGLARKPVELRRTAVDDLVQQRERDLAIPACHWSAIESAGARTVNGRAGKPVSVARALTGTARLHSVGFVSCPPQIRVVTAAGSPLLLDGVARTIRQDSGFRLVAELVDGPAALDAIREHRPDVAVLEIELPELDGRRVLEAVIRDELPTRVLLLAGDAPPETAFEAVATGARGYLSKRTTADELRNAVRRAAHGDTVLCSEAQSSLADEVRLRHRDDPGLLTARQLEIVRLMAAGRTMPDIARALQVERSTVRTHVDLLYARLGVAERAQAVGEAVRRGLID
jgi:two-component system, NarL family, nitrate/nitrite response regulator NarL